jgi:hypothetical protein
MAVLVDIADAVVAELNGHAFSKPFTAERSYRPVYSREEMKGLHVTVVPAGFTIELAGRNQSQTDYVVEVGIMHAPETLDAGAMDALMGLVEEIVAFFKFRRLAVYQVAVCMKAALAAGCERGYAAEHVDQLQQFTSVLALTFRVIG